MARERLGMLGGTFDPPHIGHAIVGQDVLERLGLDRLLLVPAGIPPHREHVLPADVRLDLVGRMVEDREGLEVSDVEVRRDGPSYTVDTLEALRGALEPDQLVCVIGADQFEVIDTWYEHQRLPALAELAVMSRDGTVPAASSQTGSIPYITVDVTRVDISGTRIRRRLRAGRSIRYLVPESIREAVERAWLEHGREAG